MCRWGLGPKEEFSFPPPPSSSVSRPSPPSPCIEERQGRKYTSFSTYCMPGPVGGALPPLVLALARIASPVFQVRKWRLRVLNLRAEARAPSSRTGAPHAGPGGALHWNSAFLCGKRPTYPRPPGLAVTWSGKSGGYRPHFREENSH